MFGEVLGQLKRLVLGVQVPLLERRKVVRTAVPNFKLVCHTETEEFAVTVLDLSVGGVKVDMEASVKVGQRLRVTQPQLGGGPVLCRVLWSGGRVARATGKVAALGFDDTKECIHRSWVTKALKRFGFGKRFGIEERRKRTRIPIQHRAALASAQGEVLADGELLNFSTGGVLIDVPTQVPEGSKINVQISPIGTLDLLDMGGVVKARSKNVDNQSYYHSVAFSNFHDENCAKYFNVLKRAL